MNFSLLFKSMWRTRHSFPPPAVLQTSSSMACGKLTLQELLPLLYSVYLAFWESGFQEMAAKEIKGKARQGNSCKFYTGHKVMMAEQVNVFLTNNVPREAMDLGAGPRFLWDA